MQCNHDNHDNLPIPNQQTLYRRNTKDSISRLIFTVTPPGSETAPGLLVDSCPWNEPHHWQANPWKNDNKPPWPVRHEL
jgi:hypothetical protein